MRFLLFRPMTRVLCFSGTKVSFCWSFSGFNKRLILFGRLNFFQKSVLTQLSTIFFLVSIFFSERMEFFTRYLFSFKMSHVALCFCVHTFFPVCQLCSSCWFVFATSWMESKNLFLHVFESFFDFRESFFLLGFRISNSFSSFCSSFSPSKFPLLYP